jgi:oligosaccharide repeat unit polymerase
MLLFFWGFPSIENATYVEINFILIVLNLFYFISYLYGKKRGLKNNSDPSPIFIIKKDQFYLLCIISLLSGFVTLYLANFNIENLVFRNSYAERVALSQTESLLLLPVYFLPFISLSFYLANFKKTTFKILILTLPTILFLFPTSLPRNFAALIYMTLMLIIFKRLVIGNRLPFFVLFGLVIIFPFLDNFRFYESNEFELLPSYDYFLAPHFDSYQSFAIVYQHKIITFGYQLLGPLLFFIPRIFWGDKPIGSGHYVAHQFELPFTNISSNIYAEAYINFGLIGCVIFALAIGFFSGKFSSLLLEKTVLTPQKIILYGLASYYIYFLRGDLMSPVAYFSAFVFSVYLCWFVLNYLDTKNNTQS